jgi:small conductance mechanosensitive channel
MPEELTTMITDLLGSFEISTDRMILRIVAAMAVIGLGFLLSRRASAAFRKALRGAKLDETLVTFFGSAFFYIFIIVVIVIALSILGIPTTSIIALLGIATLAIGLALQDSIANLASGVLIIMLRPYVVGDYVEMQSLSGFVTEIKLYHTLLTTRDNKSIYIPNKEVMSGNIVNYSETDLIRLDLVYGISYGDDVLKAKSILEEIVRQEDRIAHDPPPIVAVQGLGDSSVDFTVRPYVDVHDELEVSFSITEQVKLRFDREGLTIPFPQRDVHMIPVN